MTNDLLKHSIVMLKPDPSRTVIRPFAPEYPSAYANGSAGRRHVIVERILSMDARAVERELAEMTESLDARHRDVDPLLMRRFAEICPDIDGDTLDHDRKRLVGAYFSEEFSFESAALFNPSAVEHPDQNGVDEGCTRFVLTLRGIGEGHVSSVTLRTGLWHADGEIEIYDASQRAVPPIIKQEDGSPVAELDCSQSEHLSETVLFPTLPSQRQGIEDMRLCRFIENDGSVMYYGTYTAYDGRNARSELLTTGDFWHLTMRPMTGAMAEAKGMALFPRRIGGKFAMLGRQDSENLWFQTSDDLLHWDDGQKVIGPKYSWEYVQIGNCGSPIEIDEGWLVITHGVGTVRNYCLGAALLDKDDPSQVLARTPLPILEPSPNQRDGYVPNVVYSCGSMVRGRELLLPFGVADSFCAFATCSVDDLLARMERA
ncbi:MAG TPA: glycoside hydrolase family 130 protein [Sphingomonas sp.]|nr:glycoside hydrolase family 130 protein [Sphingomonas sp.]